MTNNTILVVLGTRPELIKLSPLLPRLGAICDHVVVVHTGQHYSYEMDALFYKELDLPEPEYRLNCGADGLGPGEQTARMLAGLEPILKKELPMLTLVQGDTNTTLAGALASVKLGIPVIHLEAGCRSFNRAMPEEINRVLVDHMSQVLLAPDEMARKNLQMEGCHQSAQIHVVGSTSIEAARRTALLVGRRPLLNAFDVNPGEYLLVTLHRAENTTPEILPGLVETLNKLVENRPVIFPVHPRTAGMINKLGLKLSPSIIQLKPLGYLDILGLTRHAKAVLTDSGGLQEEAAALGRPVLILRQETEWNYLIDAGKAALVGNTFPASYKECEFYLQPARLAAMEKASIPVPADTSGSILQIIANFTGLNIPVLAGKKEEYVKN